MNFKKYHVSKNLLNFDDLKNAESGTISTKNGQETFAAPHVLLIQAQPNTVYVLSTNYEKTGSKTNVIYYNYADASYAVYSTNSVYMTTSETGLIKIAFFDTRIGADDFLSGDSWLMLNTGSQPLPYEPYSSEVWHDIPYYQHKTATDTLTLPAMLYPNDTSITVGLKGNEEHTGTPSPQNPVMPNGTGERTRNLWNEEGFSARDITSTHEHTDTNPYGTTLSTTIGKETIITQSKYPTGTVGYQNGFFFIDVDFSKYEIGDKVTLSFDYICNEVHSIEGQVTTTLYAGKNNNSIPVVLSSGKWSVSGRLTAVITIIADMKPYVEVRLCGNSITVKNIMLNTGSTALPYEPYGYKIPISMGGTTTPVYLGEVETTRYVKKLVLEGTENVDLNTVDKNRLIVQAVYTLPKSGTTTATNIICSHLKTLGSGGATSLEQGIAMRYNGTDILFGVPFSLIGATVEDTNTTIRTKLKSYLTAQYAAGTPVTVWYVLATPETEVINEPLMKIGDYADSLTTSIPCTAGSNTLDVQTTVAPSEVTAGFSGWHPVSAAHERSGGAWD